MFYECSNSDKLEIWCKKNARKTNKNNLGVNVSKDTIDKCIRKSKNIFYKEMCHKSHTEIKEHSLKANVSQIAPKITP